MSTASVPFPDLAKRIQQQEAELANLRRELESRSRQLSELTSRKDALQAELAKVEKDIDAVTQASVTTRSAPAPKAPATSGVSKALVIPVQGVSLPKYLVSLVSAAKGPITAAELAEVVVRNKFPTRSNNIADIVKTRVYDLVKKGVFKRVGNSSGLVLAQGVSSAASKVAISSQKSGKKVTPIKSATPAIQTEPTQWRSLHEVITHVLAKRAQPLTAHELAEGVIASGYKSDSKNFVNVIWSSLGKLPSVERVAGKGYRLKKGMTKA